MTDSKPPSTQDDWTRCTHVEDGVWCGFVAYTGETLCPVHAEDEAGAKADARARVLAFLDAWMTEFPEDSWRGSTLNVAVLNGVRLRYADVALLAGKDSYPSSPSVTE